MEENWLGFPYTKNYHNKVCAEYELRQNDADLRHILESCVFLTRLLCSTSFDAIKLYDLRHFDRQLRPVEWYKTTKLS